MELSHSTSLDTPEIQERYERKKFIILGLTFFFLIAAYTIVQALKDSIFGHIVGCKPINYARFASMCALMPAIVFYSKLVDKWRRYYLLCFYAMLYAVLGLVFAYFLGHPNIGIANTNASPDRIFGWLFYFFIEGFSPFVVSVFWAFVNSVSSPKNAKNRYGNLTAFSKVGGMVSAVLCWSLLLWKNQNGQYVLSDVVSHQILMVFASFFLACIPVLILYLMYTIPGRFLHGYEAAYQAEKIKKQIGKSETGVFAGIKMLVKYPYVVGIFGMVYFYELLSVVLSYLRLRVAQEGSSCISEVSATLFSIVFFVHLSGFFISILGTRVLLNKLGERVCLMLIPTSMAIVLITFMFNSANVPVTIELSYWVSWLPNLFIYPVYFAFVLLKSVNYAFSWPVRESLYIPTVKEIKFKSKSWIDAFGAKFAKSSGATFNLVSEWAGPSFFMLSHSLFFMCALICWFLTAWLLGKRFDYAVKHNEVIGLEIDDEDAEDTVLV